MTPAEFREEVRDWLHENYPKGASQAEPGSELAKEWLAKLVERGWTAPHWPKEYGGAGLDTTYHRVLLEELLEVGADIPNGGMGMGLIGPTLLEYGTEEQKQRHLWPIVRREIRWCQGYSEPGAGSDLANVQTRAVDEGDHWVVNGQKIWTSGANLSDWIFALVRTDPDAPKHDGISFLLMDMHQPGIKTRPIQLISGSSPFCETFFDNAIARKDDLVGKLNQGWTVGKRLLQHERSGGLRVQPRRPAAEKKMPDRMGQLAKKYLGEADGKIANLAMRDEVLKHRMAQTALALTQARARDENKSGRTPEAATSIFKLMGSTLLQNDSNLSNRIMGTQGCGWEHDHFDSREYAVTREWLSGRSHTIYGGTNEVQMNIIAKRMLGLPDGGQPGTE